MISLDLPIIKYSNALRNLPRSKSKYTHGARTNGCSLQDAVRAYTNDLQIVLELCDARNKVGAEKALAAAKASWSDAVAAAEVRTCVFVGGGGGGGVVTG